MRTVTIADLCICCGQRPRQWTTQTTRHCNECQALVGRDPDMLDAWPILFAISMRRLARRAEIEKATRDIFRGVSIVTHYAGSDAGVAAYAKIVVGVSRLRALAQEAP
jgi:hypothetical protein